MKQIIVFEQDNCGWCVRLHPHIKKLAEDNSVELEFVNITKDWDIPKEFAVDLKTTPTVSVYLHGQIRDSFSIDQDGIPGLISKVKGFIDG